MTDIVDFTAAKEKARKEAEAPTIVFICGCECRTFELYADGRVECSNCGDIKHPHPNCPNSINGEWRNSLPVEVPDKADAKDDAGTVSSVQFNVPEAAKSNTVKKITDGVKDLRLVFGAFADGSTTLWTDVNDGEQREWCIRKLGILMTALKKSRVEDEKPEKK